MSKYSDKGLTPLFLATANSELLKWFLQRSSDRITASRAGAGATVSDAMKINYSEGAHGVKVADGNALSSLVVQAEAARAADKDAEVNVSDIYVAFPDAGATAANASFSVLAGAGAAAPAAASKPSFAAREEAKKEEKKAGDKGKDQLYR